MDFSKLTDRESLVAEQAVLTMRALEQAGRRRRGGKEWNRWRRSSTTRDLNICATC